MSRYKLQRAMFALIGMTFLFGGMSYRESSIQELMACLRIYSAAKTIADCLKYRKKLGGNLAGKVLRESIARRKCGEQRLRHFAKICRVQKLVHAAYSLVARRSIDRTLCGIRYETSDSEKRG